MLISEVIQKIKDYSRGIDSHTGKAIDEEKTRDKVLYGDVNKECTGIVTTCFASVEVIEKAHQAGVNLIIPHEALFWNHGDKQERWQKEEVSVYLRKKKLLDDYGITVWRDHDYIHSGVPDGNGGWMDGIFKGFLHYTDLEQYYVGYIHEAVKFNKLPIILKVPGLTAREIAAKIIQGIDLNGIRAIGNLDMPMETVAIPMHCIGFADEDTISILNQKHVDGLITMELIDYTVNEYMRDGALLKDPKSILAVGHFNVEEPGMRYMINWLPEAIGCDSIPMTFIPSGDMNQFLLK